MRMKTSEECVQDMIETRSDQGLVVLPLTLAFRNGRGRTGTAMAGLRRAGSLVARYPAPWKQVSAQIREAALCELEDGSVLAECGCCQQLVLPGRTQAAHLGWDAEDLDDDWVMALCLECHREWDRPQQDSGAALTAACEHTLTYSHYLQCLAGIRREVNQHGLIRLAPAALDLVVAATLQDGPCARRRLGTRLRRQFPMVVRAVGSVADLERCLEASLTRLGMRQIDRTRQPLVRVQRGMVELGLDRLHHDRNIRFRAASPRSTLRHVDDSSAGNW